MRNVKTERQRPSRFGRALLALLLSLCPLHAAWADGWNLKDKDGIQFRLAEQKGKWVLVNFWAPWCSECLQEIPELNALQKQHKDIFVISVAVMYKKPQEVIDTARAKAISYPVVLGDEDIASDFGKMKGMPTSFLYSPSGTLVGHHDGALTRQDVERAMARKPDAVELFPR